MNILVTGGAGYIGAITSKKLALEGFTPIIFDSLEKGDSKSVKEFELIKGNILDTDLLIETIKSKNIQAVMHFAAYIQMGESMQDPQKYFLNNTCGSLSLLKAMRQTGLDKFIFSSTAGVYGNPVSVPIKEEDQKKPTNPYGESKLMIEKVLNWYGEQYNFNSISLRYFNASGASLDGKLGENHQPETHLIPNIIKAVLSDNEFTLNGTDYETDDGSCIRDYIHVEDLAQAHVLALKALLAGHKTDCYNVGTGSGFSNKQVLAKVEEVTGKKVKLIIGPRRPGDANVLVSDPSKFQKEFNWKPESSDLDTIVKTAFEWHKKLH